MSSLETTLERIAEAGVAGIALRELREPRARRQARARRIGAAIAVMGIVLAAVAVAVVIRSPGHARPPTSAHGKLVADASYTVPSESMSPTLMVGDVVSAANRFGALEQGDVVRVRFPKESTVAVPPGGDAGFKRVVGLPGDSLEARGGHLYVNGRERIEPYTHAFTSDFAAVVVPRGSYFLLGDNRENSKDSREWGPVSRSDIIAIALRVTAPAARAGAVVGSPR
jgi:signal peptidase I